MKTVTLNIDVTYNVTKTVELSKEEYNGFIKNSQFDDNTYFLCEKDSDINAAQEWLHNNIYEHEGFSWEHEVEIIEEHES